MAFVNFVAIKTPPAGVALAGKAFELFNAAFGIVSASDILQVVPDQLIQAFAQGFRFLAGTGHELIVNGKSNIH
jgi:hypothetical protein